MMQKQLLLEEISDIDRLIEAINDPLYPNCDPITDGIIDIDKYLGSKTKILWILKEPYDDVDTDGKPCGGGWSIPEMIRSKNSIYDFEGGGRPTYRPMIYSAWGVFNNFVQWELMDNVEDNPKMLDALKSIAYINIKKLPGMTSSPNSVIQDAYDKNKDILFKQISCIDPDIIIWGYTVSYFWNDIGVTLAQFQKFGSLKYFISGNKLYIDTFHPSQRTVSQKEYCNDIINVVKSWSLKLLS